ncbi:MAG: DUF4123 domain-containing protein [Massilia sp.]
MLTFRSDLAALEALALDHPQWNWYAIADSAQHRALPEALVREGAELRCLLGAAQGSPVARQAPHLVALGSPLDSSSAWKWIGLHAHAAPCVTLIASGASFDVLFAQLASCTEAVLPDGDAMFFGFWDPAILATLVGQADDATLHVRGPVLDAHQRAVLLAQKDGWWYWDREGHFHRLRMEAVDAAGEAPLQLRQEQVDQLVEASVPDHVVYFLELNQPALIEQIPREARYRHVRDALADARAHGLSTMQDMVNFVCAALIYRERFDSDPAITALLADVRHGKLAFADALAQMP